MALIDCYECGKQISDIAPACPSCGAPASKPDVQIDGSFIAKPKPTRTVGFGLFMGIIFAPFIFFWFLLRDGYSNKVKALGLCWLVIFAYGYFYPSKGVKGFQLYNASSSEPVSKLKLMEEKYPDSSATYNDVNSEVGCASKYSDQKKEDIFEGEFKNRWMVWTGVVVLADADDVSLNVDGIGTQDLQVDFLDKGAGYNLKKGQKVKVRFLMTSAGGCFLPFSGDYAVIDGQREYGKVGDIFREVKKQEETSENKEENIDPLTYTFKGDAAKAQVVASQSVSWAIQVASLSNLNVAEGLQRALRSEGYESYITTTVSTNRVFVGPFQERAEAERIRNQLGRQNQLKGFVVRYKSPSD